MTSKLLAVIAAASLAFLSGYETKSLEQRPALNAVHADGSALATQLPANYALKSPFNSTVAYEINPKLTYPKVANIEGESPAVGIDGYLFEGAQYRPLKTFKVKMVYASSLAQIRKESGNDGEVAYTITPDGNGGTCEIHIVDPRRLYWPEYIGHEFVHCLVGNFHSKQDIVGKAVIDRWPDDQKEAS